MASPSVRLIVGPDHAVPIEPQSGLAVVTVDAGAGPVYFSNSLPVSSTVNQGSISGGGSATFTQNAWIIASASTGVTVAVTSIYDEWAASGLPTSGAPSAGIATSILTPTGGDDSTPMNTALAAGSAALPPRILMAPGTFNWNVRVPAIQRTIPNVIWGSGVDLTTVRLSASALRFLDPLKVADDDVFDLELRYLTIDCQSLTGGYHVLFGTLGAGGLASGTFMTRVGLTRLIIDNCRTINVPTSSTGAYRRRNIAWVCAQGTDNTPPWDTISNVQITNNVFGGGAYGAEIAGTGGGGISCDVLIDGVLIENNVWDAGVTPTAAMGSNGGGYFVGSAAQTRNVVIRNNIARNSCDVNIELDNCANGTIENNYLQDAWNDDILVRNFRPPPDAGVAGHGNDVAGQVVIVAKNTIANLNVDPAAASSQVNHISTQGPSPIGRVIISDNLHRFESSMVTPSVSGMAVECVAPINRIDVIRPTISCPNMLINPVGSIFPCWIDLRSSTTGARVTVKNADFVFAGTRSGTQTISWKLVRIAGQAKGIVDGVSADFSGLAGMIAADNVYWALLDDGLTSTLSMVIKRLVAPLAPTGGTFHVTRLSSTATLTVVGKVIVDECDTGLLPGSAGHDYDVDATQASQVLIRGWQSARTAANGGPLQDKVALAPGTGTFTYTNADFVNELVVVSGGTVTVIAITPSGGTQYTLGVLSGEFLLRPGDTIAVTNSVAPTMVKRPAV